MICTACHGTGSRSKHLYGDLDCALCDNAERRAKLNEALKSMSMVPIDGPGRDWIAYRLGYLAALADAARGIQAINRPDHA